jgi:hypothetical protein
MADKKLRTDSSLRPWAVIFVAIALMILAGDYWYYRDEAEKIHHENYQAVSTIGNFKSEMTQQWRKERLCGITLVAKSPFLTKAIEEFSRGSASPDLRDELWEVLNAVVVVNNNSAAPLLDLDGDFLLCVKDTIDPVDAATQRAIASAVTNRETVLSAFSAPLMETCILTPSQWCWTQRDSRANLPKF